MTAHKCEEDHDGFCYYCFRSMLGDENDSNDGNDDKK